MCTEIKKVPEVLRVIRTAERTVRTVCYRANLQILADTFYNRINNII